MRDETGRLKDHSSVPGDLVLAKYNSILWESIADNGFGHGNGPLTTKDEPVLVLASMTWHLSYGGNARNEATYLLVLSQGGTGWVHETNVSVLTSRA